MRAWAGMVLALLFWGCGSDRSVLCTKEPVAAGARACARECASGECFKRQEAHCFRRGPWYCTPTPEECNALRASVGETSVCRPVPADEI